MAKNTGAIQLTGTIGNVTIDKNGNARLKQQSRPVTSPRTAENNAEFGTAGRAGKLVRDAMRRVLSLVPSGTSTGRLTAALRAIIGFDTTNGRGLRQVLKANIGALLGFQFNDGASLASNLYAARTVGTDAQGVVTVGFASIDPMTDVSAPQGATHVGVMGAAVAIDFVAGTVREATETTTIVPMALNGGPVANQQLVLDLGGAVTGTESLIVTLGVVYYQEVNGQLYPLANGSYAALDVVVAE